MKVTAEIEINAPVANVYEAFSDIEAAEKNIEAIDSIEMVKKPKGLVGTRWKETRTEFGKTATVEMWITDAKKNKYYEVESVDHGIKYKSVFRFEKLSGDKTKVVLDFSGEPLTFGAKLMSLMLVFFKKSTKKLFLKDMEDLKQTLEEN